MEPIEISTAPPPQATYEVLVEPGSLDRLPALLADAVPAHHYAIIADSTVATRYGEGVRARLEAAGQRASLFAFDAGEANKTRNTWAELTDALLAARIGRDGAVIALGGGVTGDLAGFVAATYLRGLPLVQVPTTLLAMVDSSVGGKTGVDTGMGKNLVGAFHPPRLVVADPRVLATLPEEELRSGLAEAVKHGAIADPVYLDTIEGGGARLLAGDADALTALVHRSIEIKASFAAVDPYETGPRKALNFGHTIGHAVEASTSYVVPHGYAVAIGMVAEAVLGEAVGITEAGTAAVLRRVLHSLGLPTSIPATLSVPEIISVARRDKKARQSRTRYTLLSRIGDVARGEAGEWTFALEEESVTAVLAGIHDRAIESP